MAMATFMVRNNMECAVEHDCSPHSHQNVKEDMKSATGRQRIPIPLARLVPNTAPWQQSKLLGHQLVNQQ